jgi:hypothetical protein
MGRSRPLIVNNYAQGRSAVSGKAKSQDSGERGCSADGALGATGRLKHVNNQALKSKKDTAVTRMGMDTRGWVWVYTPTRRPVGGWPGRSST